MVVSRYMPQRQDLDKLSLPGKTKWPPGCPYMDPRPVPSQRSSRMEGGRKITESLWFEPKLAQVRRLKPKIASNPHADPTMRAQAVCCKVRMCERMQRCCCNVERVTTTCRRFLEYRTNRLANLFRSCNHCSCLSALSLLWSSWILWWGGVDNNKSGPVPGPAKQSVCDDFNSPRCVFESVLWKSKYVLPNCRQLARPGGTWVQLRRKRLPVDANLTRWYQIVHGRVCRSRRIATCRKSVDQEKYYHAPCANLFFRNMLNSTT